MRLLLCTTLWRKRTRTHAIVSTRWKLCGRFLLSALAAFETPRVAFTTAVGSDAPTNCIETRSFSREISTFSENIRRRQDRQYRLIVSYCGRCYRCNQLLKDGPRDQGGVHPMTLWVNGITEEIADDFSD